MWKFFKLLNRWRKVRFLHICHAYKFEISPHDKFFSTYLICDICDKYQVCVVFAKKKGATQLIKNFPLLPWHYYKHTSPLIYLGGALVTFLKACMNICKTIAPRCLRMSPRHWSICPLSTKSLWTDNVGLFHKGKNKDGTISCLRLLLIVDQKGPPKIANITEWHLAHLCGFSLLWIMICFLRVPPLLNDLMTLMTLSTYARLLSTVGQKVTPQIAKFVKWLCSLSTCVHLLSTAN